MSNSSKVYKHIVSSNLFGVADKIKNFRKPVVRVNRKNKR